MNKPLHLVLGHKSELSRND